ncbi:MAG TPA: triose-phosphate isomerase [Xanthobacteraceae bacterium]|jgi:triosephosphate isomerase
MAAGRRPLVAGNWKMNGLRGAIVELGKVIAGYDVALAEQVDLLVCPPATLISAFAEQTKGTKIAIGGQDCHAKPAGAHTGDLSAEMLHDAGASAVIVGHSERRKDHGETDAMVRAKADAALRAKLTAIVCVGETREQREARKTLEVVGAQLKGSVPAGARPATVVIAYEPVWAIGTGLTPTVADVAEVHKMIRDALERRFGAAARGIRIIYGGSVKAENAAALLTADDVDGALVGGASLKAEDFLAISKVYLKR